MSALKNFEFTKDTILENERVLLRPLALADITFLEKYVLEEPALWKFSLVAIQNKTDLEKYIQDALLKGH
jgi:hypothetical protein